MTGKLEEFTKEDWYGLCGAVKPSETQEPLISYDLVVTDWPENLEHKLGTGVNSVQMVVDGQGVFIAGADIYYHLTVPFPIGKVVGESLLSKSPVIVEDLNCLGFYQLPF